ncbi:MAG: CotH kinase family protein [Clostridia bacterium]|nr:CotH kinase family protein [Clostridia bacterium]
MKKILSLFLAFIMAFSAFALCGTAADDALSGVYAMQDDLTADDGVDRKISLYEHNGTYYLFVPASVNAYLADFVVSDATAKINGVAYTETKKLAEVFGDKAEITLSLGGTDYKIVMLSESKVASVFIATESGSLDFIHAQKGNEEEGFIEIADPAGITVYEGELEIKGRGNSTWEMEKKPYNIKLADKVNLFGMGKTKKWSLIANHGDNSLIRNVLAYEAAERAGMPYTPQFTPVDVYINSDYMGSYLLTTRVGIDGSSVDIDDLEGETEDVNKEDLDTYARGGAYGTYAGLLEGTQKWYEIPNDPEDITGGYIIEMELANRYAAEASGFVTTRSQPFTMKTPEYASKAQIQYISSYYQKVEDAIYNGASMTELDKLVDVESLAQMYLINEWASNQDASLTSTYFYKPAGDKLYAGPVWDFDIGFGNNDSNRFGNDYTDPEKWTVCYNRMYRNTVFGSWDIDEQPTVFNVLTKNAGFAAETEKVWNNGTKAAVADTIKWATDVYVPFIEGSAVANAIRWNVFDTTDVAAIKTAFSKETQYVIGFAGVKANTISEGVGKVQTDAPETNAFVKFFKGFLVGINDLFEKLIVTFDLVNKI